MQRRTMLAALGSVAVGGATAMSTGAFTSVSTNRGVDVSVASDTDALLALRPADTPNGAYATAANGTLSLDVTGADGGPGVNPDALTVLDDVFRVENRGTSTVELTGEKTGSYPDAVVFGVNQARGGFTELDVFHTLDPEAPTGIDSDLLFEGEQPRGSGSRQIPVGHSYYVSLLIDTRGISADEVLIDGLELTADAV
ncbi:hypothetical protein [Halobaculum sp. MBLA0143]|uniref:hypothetical protein n=1 Tax=Halobaculum sp. MBLA0143 TaxID=3079933 RepID=UPI0035251E8C